MKWYFYLVVSIFVSLGGIAVSQQRDASISATITKGVLKVDEVVYLQLTSVGGPLNPIPPAIKLDGVSITYSSSVPPKGDKYSYFYTVRGSRSGKYMVPSIRVVIGGQRVASKPLPFSILDSAPRGVIPKGPTFATMAIPEGEIYVNQIFPVRCKVYVEGRNALRDFSDASLTHENFAVKRFAQLESGETDIKNTVYSTRDLTTSAFSLKAGDHRLGPAEFKTRVYQNLSPFSGTSMNRNLRTVLIKSDTVRVNVLPFPIGAPFSFSGGVGSFEMETKISTQELKVGDPISFDFTVTGLGNLETLGPPQIYNLDSKVWKFYEPKKVQVKESDGITPGINTYNYVLIPLQEVSATPIFELSFFEPKVKQYIRRRSLSYPIKVVPDSSAPLATSGSAPVGFSQPVNPFGVKPPIAQFPDILHIRTAMPKWRKYSALPPRPIGLIVMNVLLGVFCSGALVFGVLRKRKENKVEKASGPTPLTFKEAFQKVRPGMEREEFYHSAHEAFGLWEEEHLDAPKDC